ncbi:DICT sensory domain-containing protein [Kallotenue papyrolyticum]|uniref:DICT sensory domain-containing protein n=1 Tax=Kallotenue papyrolyticum TaxID=1325125 RepID=UPI0004925603|nr:DICT sensory domain-containing protein [Kallotenue papyrolyticum]
MTAVSPPAALGQLSLFELITDYPGHFLRVKRTMIDLSHAIEEAAARTAQPGWLFAGFQRFSLFRSEAQRYARLAAALRGCYIFGVPDVAPPELPGITALALPQESPLCREWFVVVDGPDFATALLSADVTGDALPDPMRRFMGIWSADPTLVRAASTRLCAALDLPTPDWQPNLGGTLAGYEAISNYVLALSEERWLTRRRRHQPAAGAVDEPLCT